MARYLTTTLPYVNANPHLGHALEFVEADFLARARKAKGEEVFLTIGTDEHGAKIAKKAEEEGKSPQEYADDYAGRFKAFADRLDISYDAFLRTTDPAHLKAAQEFWRRCSEAGDIYLAEYEVKYCIGCELEKTESELVEGRCPIHPTLEIEIREEENYYFRFSKYQEKLLAVYEDRAFILPPERLKEIKSFVAAGLKDFSISRKKERLAWGVPVPGDDAHVMYVWFDALVSYISAIGWPADAEKFGKWWPVEQLAGKDNLRQQSAMWQAMLFSAGLPHSRRVFIHGNLVSGGQKMSKTLGNVIDPMALVDRYGAEALRYVLLRHANPFEDTDLTLEYIHEQYTANLVNGLGNLVARVMTLAEAHLPHPAELRDADERIAPEFFEKVEAYRFNEAMDAVFEGIAEADRFMTRNAPYKKIKSGDAVEREEARKDIEELVRRLASVAAHLAPALPRTAAAIAAAIRTNKKPENLFPRI
ncbi:MAG TPA: methionine--tRNA ligase [Candidatus Paceibacterota bacterium]|nr:methionine--tRNA ligase [Candidatus Paceibacterota bacterium]